MDRRGCNGSNSGGAGTCSQRTAGVSRLVTVFFNGQVTHRAQRRARMRRTEAQPYFQPIGERDRFLPEGPRAMRRRSREGIAWVNIQRDPDSTYGSLFFYDPTEPREEGEQLVSDHRLDCPG